MPLVVEKTRPDGKRGLSFQLHPGQRRAWNSTKRIVAIIAGVRGGKTSFGPLWLHRECKLRGPGDYLIVTPNYPLLDKAAGPEFEHHFVTRYRLGTLTRHPWCFTFSDAAAHRLWGCVPERKARVLFGHADDPESLAGMTARAAWCDEAGQKRFRLGSWEEIQRRVSFDRGRILLTSTPYDSGWLKTHLYDPWIASGRNHPDIDLIQFKSIENPDFPREEYERARRTLPGWKFRMFFHAEFERPAGLIYDSFDPLRHVRPDFRVPREWPRFGGSDFGAVNFGAVLLAGEMDLHNAPSGRYVLYREYHPGQQREPEEHIRAILEGESGHPLMVGGNPNEDEWRQCFCAAGLAMAAPPVTDVEVGIGCVYSLCAQGRLIVVESCTKILDEFASYSRVVDEKGEPTDKIDDPHSYHLLDSLRYISTYLERGNIAWTPGDHPEARTIMSQAPEGVFHSDPEDPPHDDPGSISFGSWQ